MTIFQYLLLGMCAVVIAGTPYLLVKSIRRKQIYRLVEIPILDSLVIYLTIYNVWPAAISSMVAPSAPLLVRYLFYVLIILWFANFFGVIRWLFNRQKAVPVGRS